MSKSSGAILAFDEIGKERIHLDCGGFDAEEPGGKRSCARTTERIGDVSNRTGGFTERPFHELGSEGLLEPSSYLKRQCL